MISRARSQWGRDEIYPDPSPGGCATHLAAMGGPVWAFKCPKLGCGNAKWSAGWWLTYPSRKYESRQWEGWHPIYIYMKWKINDLWNHQPVICSLSTTQTAPSKEQSPDWMAQLIAIPQCQQQIFEGHQAALSSRSDKNVPDCFGVSEKLMLEVVHFYMA